MTSNRPRYMFPLSDCEVKTIELAASTGRAQINNTFLAPYQYLTTNTGIIPVRLENLHVPLIVGFFRLFIWIWKISAPFLMVINFHRYTYAHTHTNIHLCTAAACQRLMVDIFKFFSKISKSIINHNLLPLC